MSSLCFGTVFGRFCLDGLMVLARPGAVTVGSRGKADGSLIWAECGEPNFNQIGRNVFPICVHPMPCHLIVCWNSVSVDLSFILRMHLEKKLKKRQT